MIFWASGGKKRGRAAVRLLQPLGRNLNLFRNGDQIAITGRYARGIDFANSISRIGSRISPPGLWAKDALHKGRLPRLQPDQQRQDNEHVDMLAGVF